MICFDLFSSFNIFSNMFLIYFNLFSFLLELFRYKKKQC
nr:MAG TPA: hypothetical protein [Caudoviricetes sp.]